MKNFLFLLFIGIIPATSGAGGNFCENLFGISDLEKSIQGLAELRIQIDIAKSKNDSSIAASALTAEYSKKEESLYSYLRKFNLTREQLRARIKTQIEATQKNTAIEKVLDLEKRWKSKELIDHIVDGNRAVFHRVEPGSFQARDRELSVVPHKNYTVEVKKPFELMATHVTQKVWKDIAELANHKYGYTINPDPSYSKGFNFPVEQITYLQVRTFLRAINEMSDSGATELEDILVGHKNGDKYRLPSQQEWEYVARGAGIFKDDVQAELQLRTSHDWFDGFQDNEPLRPVADKPPIIVGGKEFYDMMGNALQYVAGIYIKPDNPKLDLRLYVGAGVTSNKYSLNYSADWIRADLTLAYLGLRLVRVVKAP